MVLNVFVCFVFVSFLAPTVIYLTVFAVLVEGFRRDISYL